MNFVANVKSPCLTGLGHVIGCTKHVVFRVTIFVTTKFQKFRALFKTDRSAAFLLNFEPPQQLCNAAKTLEQTRCLFDSKESLRSSHLHCLLPEDICNLSLITGRLSSKNMISTVPSACKTGVFTVNY